MTAPQPADGLQVGFPFQLDPQGRVASTDEAHHVEQMIIQLLLTAPGERVNRPTFGVGLLARVFEPDDSATATAVHLEVIGALQRWLSDVLEVRSVDVQAVGAGLRIDIAYVVLRTRRLHRTIVER